MSRLVVRRGQEVSGAKNYVAYLPHIGFTRGYSDLVVSMKVSKDCKIFLTKFHFLNLEFRFVAGLQNFMLDYRCLHGDGILMAAEKPIGWNYFACCGGGRGVVVIGGRLVVDVLCTLIEII